MTPRPEIPAALRQTAQSMTATRGRLLQLRRTLDRSLIPTLMVDNERCYTDANTAARLLFRMPLQELRRHRIDDLTAVENLPLMEEAWAELLDRGTLSDRYHVTFKDGSKLWVFYAALANALPGRHLIVFVPADWPGDELEELRPRDDEESRGPLSCRQLDVLRLVAVGASAPQIATELSISESTVRTHIKNILHRLGVNNRAHAVAVAMTDGMLGENPPTVSNHASSRT